MVLDERKNKLLQLIVEEYIETAVPVSSGQLVSKYDLGVSSATVRNDMVTLEQEGLIASPHTSAGRIPTEHGYRVYVINEIESIMKAQAQEHKDLVTAYKKEKDEREKMKNLARLLAEMTQSAVIIGFNSNDVYYTGLSNLFAQPEFHDYQLMYSISAMVDQLDHILPNIMASVKGNDVRIMIGSENPVSERCSLIGFMPGRDQMVGLLGPIRMDYKRNIAYMKHVQTLLS